MIAWQVPSFLEQQQEPATLQRVDDALLSPVAHGPLRSLHPPRRWLRGAVYDATGRLVPQSQKIGGLHGHNWVPADPPRTKAPATTERLEGTWLYGGHWVQQFGHFIIETLTTLWPQEQVEGLAFHKYLKRPWSIEPWQARLLELAGYGDLPVRVVGGRKPLRVESLLVPSRAVVANGWVDPHAVEVWTRIAAAVPPLTASPARVYLSRTAHHARLHEASRKGRRSSAERDAALDALFAAAGFEVVAPESLPVDEQIALAAGAEVIAGCSGSALHLSAFAPAGTQVLELGDDRSPGRPVPLQLLIDAARGHEHAFVPADVPVAGITRVLADLGLSESPARGSRWRRSRG